MKNKLSLSPKMMELLKKDELIQLKGGLGPGKDTNVGIACGTEIKTNICTLNKCTNNCKKIAMYK